MRVPRKTRVSVLVLGVLAVAVAAGLRIQDHLASPAPAPQRPLAVETAALTPGPFQQTRTYVGSVEARRRAVISTRISGVLEELYYREGEPVPAGVPIARLDSAELRREVNRLEASLRRTRTDLAFWREQRGRDQRLFTQGHLPQRTRDESVRQAESLEAALTEQQEALEAARIRLGYAELSAPFAGRVQRVEAEPGELLMPGQQVMELVGTGELKAIFPVPQADLAGLRPGTRARVTLPEGENFDGAVARVQPALDPLTRNAAFEIDIPAGMPWRPGAQVHAAVIHMHRQNALSIPTHALRRRQGEAGVFLLNDSGSSVRWAPVRPGASGQGRTLVEGLQPGDQVVVTPHPALRDGSPVAVRNNWQDAP